MLPFIKAMYPPLWIFPWQKRKNSAKALISVGKINSEITSACLIVLGPSRPPKGPGQSLIRFVSAPIISVGVSFDSAALLISMPQYSQLEISELVFAPHVGQLTCDIF